MMKAQTRHIRYFFFSQYLSDGVRITLTILLPALICARYDRLDIGLLISLGALCASISDAPGPLEHKKNGMMYANVFVFLMSLLTGFANHHTILLGGLILSAAFLFTMFAIYGIRAASVGSAALLVMILRMDIKAPAAQIIMESLLILAGGIWYMVVALLFYLVRPYRQAQRSLGNCIHETSKLLLIKAALYDTDTNVEDEYQKMLAQQVVVNEKQDEVREILFKSKEIVKDSSPTGQILLITFTDVLDLYEQITATWYNYPMLRERFSATGILPQISTLIKDIAHELDRAGLAIQSNIPFKKQYEVLPALNELKAMIDAAKIENTSNLVLKKILINLRNLGDRAESIANYFVADIDPATQISKRSDYSKFVGHQEISVAIFRDNLSLNSAAFRHSLRMMITCLLGFIIVEMISYGHHSNWILLTIVFILKPGYSITKQRNLERIAGTVAGGLLGILLIATIKDRMLLLSLMVFFMIGTYTFQRLNYIVMVILMTPYILILFSYLGFGFINIVEERVLDTAIASVLAFFASYYLFPHWESKQLDAYMVSVLKANTAYLHQLKCFFSGKASSVLEYKLIRKELYVSTANLLAAFNRMMSEPKNKRQYPEEINQFVVLNNVLSSNVAGLFAINLSKEQPAITKETLHSINRSVSILEESMLLMDNSYQPFEKVPCSLPALPANKLGDHHIQEHVDFIYKLAIDIRKVVKKVNG